VTLLRQCVPVPSSEAPPAFVSSALWLLGNVAAADEAGAAAFSAAGGAALLVALLSSAAADAPAHGAGPEGAAARPSAGDTLLLHACMAAACLSTHAVGAVALLRAGAIPALARCLPPPARPITWPPLTGLQAAAPARSHPRASWTQRPHAAPLQACCGTAGAQTGPQSCTRRRRAASWRPAGPSPPALRPCGAPLPPPCQEDALPVECAACAAEALLGALGCAAAAAAAAEAASVDGPSCVLGGSSWQRQRAAATTRRRGSRAVAAGGTGAADAAALGARTASDDGRVSMQAGHRRERRRRC